MRREPVKAYGSLAPATQEAREAFEAVCAEWSAPAQVELAGGLLRFSFEGVFFPGDEAAQALEPFLSADSSGRIDVLDMEAWTLTRFVFTDGKIVRSVRDLNHVLDYSGH